MMKKFISIFLCNILLISFNVSFSQKLPPGTIKVKELNSFIDKYEVTNLAWLEYLFWLKDKYGENSAEYNNALPDSAIWYSVYNGKFISQNDFRNYPVVGVTFEQANKYCEWRSIVVNEKYSNKNKKVIYKLPSLDEFEQLYSIIKPEIKNEKGIIYPVDKLNSNVKVIGLCDNVSEMTSTYGIAYGSNWTLKDTICNIKLNYDKPTNWIGFRCIAKFEKLK